MLYRFYSRIGLGITFAERSEKLNVIRWDWPNWERFADAPPAPLCRTMGCRQPLQSLTNWVICKYPLWLLAISLHPILNLYLYLYLYGNTLY